MFYKLDDFRFTRQDVAIGDYRVPGAKYFGVSFCTRCGSAAPRISKERNSVVVPAGTLDTDPGIQPAMHIYVADKACWFEITDSIPQYQTLPA